MCWLFGLGHCRAGKWSQGGRERWMDLSSLAKGIVVQGVSQMCRQKDPVISHHCHQHGVRPAVAFSVAPRDTGFIIFHPDNDQ